MSGNPFQLQGRVATVTGGGRGIGRGIVLALAQAGADIAIADIDLDSARKTAGEVEALGQRVCVVSVDVTDAISCRAGAETILEDLGGIHVLVNNAGVVQARSDAEVDAKDFERCYGVNLVGSWNMSSAVLPHFRQQGEGRHAGAQGYFFYGVGAQSARRQVIKQQRQGCGDGQPGGGVCQPASPGRRGKRHSRFSRCRPPPGGSTKCMPSRPSMSSTSVSSVSRMNTRSASRLGGPGTRGVSTSVGTPARRAASRASSGVAW